MYTAKSTIIFTSKSVLDSQEDKERDNAAKIASAIDEGVKLGEERGLKKGLKQGKAEGLKQGKEEGLKQGKEEMARNMLKDNVDINTISKYKGLSIEEIQKLTKK